MESLKKLLLVALIATSAIHLVQAQNQDGFISVDCGLSPNEVSPYIEPFTGLQFTTDSNFIETGKLGRIQASLEPKYRKSQTTLRYFPDGIRNCYNLTVTQGTNYLIRARAIYGNYDGLNIYPKFDLYIGPNFWVTIDLGKYVNGTWEEIIYIPTSNMLDVCLVKTGPSTPLISSLVLRPLANATYITQSGWLKTYVRVYLSDSNDVIRYPDDVYDRIWGSYFEPEWKKISTTLGVNSSTGFLPPLKALMTAASPANASAPLAIPGVLDFPSDKLYLFLHFSEIQVLKANETREFEIFWNKKLVYNAYSPVYLQTKTIRNPSPVTCERGECILEMIKTERSTLPPLLNAVEVFTVVEFPQPETDASDVVAIKNIKTIYGLARVTWQGDPCVPQKFLWNGLNCNSMETSTPPRITSLDLSSSGLTGSISVVIQNLTNLEKLDLSNNNLTGEVPDFLANMKFLMFINLSKNNLNGLIPKALRDRENKGLKLIVDKNVDNCSSGSCTKKKKFPLLIVALTVSLILASTMVIDMTNNFQRALGEGGFGVVYHGYLNGSEQVAVKLLSQSSVQGYKEFKAEVELLLRVHHINLVSLVGYCDDRNHLALVYEYMSNGDLKHHLSGRNNGFVLSWSTRLQIAVDAALGLEYLHIGCRPSMVHRDVKSTNILLGEQFTAKMADFGLSRSFQIGDENHISTVVAGTPGYLDPEYYRTSRLAEKSDIYSFGIVLLEMITSQHAIDRTRVKHHITDWVVSLISRGDITRIIDPNLQGNYNSRSVWRALELAMSCANPTSEKRPNMSQVVIDLKECLATENSTRSEKDMSSHSSDLDRSMNFYTDMVPRAR
ncbi:unnamed protein product [Arabidopsis thaliana]|uniref:non-specific serine/threonine protein kinase n=1 Tax=Arabidopsis thaliana TaxID=3702 RepID=A0A5S9XIC1_ARATH|nr:unnamed protein product [Arabidopsis thaliana]